jgi:hypothetical protein
VASILVCFFLLLHFFSTGYNARIGRTAKISFNFNKKKLSEFVIQAGSYNILCKSFSESFVISWPVIHQTIPTFDVVSTDKVDLNKMF